MPSLVLPQVASARRFLTILIKKRRGIYFSWRGKYIFSLLQNPGSVRAPQLVGLPLAKNAIPHKSTGDGASPSIFTLRRPPEASFLIPLNSNGAPRPAGGGIYLFFQSELTGTPHCTPPALITHGQPPRVGERILEYFWDFQKLGLFQKMVILETTVHQTLSEIGPIDAGILRNA